MDPGFGDLENSPAVQIAEDTEFRRLTVRKVCSGDRAKGVAGQPFASTKEIRCVTHGSSQPFQQKSGTGTESSMKNLWRTLLSNGVNPRDFRRRPTKFLRMNVILPETLTGWLARNGDRRK